MKSKYLFKLVSVLYLILNIDASETLAGGQKGYKGLEWGSTVDEVKEMYPGLYQNKKKHSLYYFESNSEVINRRKFEFVDGGLVEVIEFYDMKLADSKSLLEQLINNYGDSYEVNSRTDTVNGIKLPSTVKTWLDSDGTTVEYSHWLYLGKISININVIYTDASLNKDQDDIEENENKTENVKVPRGYYGIDWGLSVETVRTKYPELVKSQGNSTLVEYWSLKSSRLIWKRKFTFWNGRLMGVHVFYDITVQYDKLLEELIKLYGNYQRNDMKYNSSGGYESGSISWEDNDETSVYFTKEKVKQTSQGNTGQSGVADLSGLFVMYVSEELYDEYFENRKKLLQEKPVEF